MKRINYLFALLATVLAFSACTSEVDNYFDKSASERAAEAVSNAKQALLAAPNGWRMEYYGDMTYGGYNILCKFSGDEVTVAAEKMGQKQEAGFDSNGKLITATSHYTVDQSQGVVLSFDGYNSVFHYFSDPKNVDGIGTAGEGLYGDFEFRVMSVSADKIVLQGRKHGNKIIMYAMDNNTTWSDYLKEVDATENYMASRSYTLMGDSVKREVKVTQSYRRLVFSYLDNDSTTKQVVAPFIVTPQGYKLYDTVNVDGVKITSFAKGDTYERFYPEGVKNLWLETEVPPIYQSLQSGAWFFVKSQFGSYALPKWNAFEEVLKTAGVNGTEQTLYWAFIGTYQGKFGFHFQAGGDYGFVSMSLVDPNEAGDEVSIKYDKTGSTNKTATSYINKFKLDPVIKTFAGLGGRPRRFKLETDNQRRPTYIKFTDTKEPTNVFTLSANEVHYPFKN